MPRRIAGARSAEQFGINAQCGGEVRSNSVLTRNAVEKCEVEEQAPPSPLAPLYKFCYYIQMCCDVF